jgi:hypothetical protein
MRFVSKFSRWPLLAGAASILAASTLLSGQAALAQGRQPGRPSIGVQAFNACTATDYGDVVAKAIGITAAELRKDIVAGQSLQDIVAAKKVDIQTVAAALQAARKADIDQAVKDGVLTQDEATAMETVPAAPGSNASAPNGGNGNAPNGNNGNGPNSVPGGNSGSGPNGGNGNGQRGQQPPAFLGNPLPDISDMRFLLQLQPNAQGVPGNGRRAGGFPGGFGAFGGTLFNLVRPYDVTAQALNLKCTDLVKTLITPPGKSITAVAADQKVDTQAVVDALSKAYKDAMAQDVTDGVITQAQSDQLSANLDKAVAAFVDNPAPMQLRPQATQAQ